MASTLSPRDSTGTPALATDEDGVTRSIARQVSFVLVAIAVLAVIFLSATAHAVFVINDKSIAADTERARLALSHNLTLDEVALEAIEQTYQLSGARLTLPGDVRDEEASIDISRADGRVFAWIPRRMGTEVFFAIAPIRITAAGLLIAAIAFVLHRLYTLARHLDRRRAAARSQAVEDSLTGVASRLGFNEALQAQLIEGREKRRRAALVLLDLDGFKVVNDRLGHLAGDHLLREIAARIKAYAHPDDLVARLGGDEFAIIRRVRAEPGPLEEFAHDLVHLLSAPCHIDGRKASVTVSLGVARIPDDADEADALLRAADAALYRAKARGGSGFELADAVLKRPVGPVSRPAA
jgi:diguanylate cyclase (GGDEF)-like protein